jgi:alpha-L-arabinofuranosidase
MGALRAANGHQVPYNVLWWGIGNEMYGDWQLGHMPLADYVQKHKAFAEAMRQADSDIKLVAVGASGPWSETMLAEAADHMHLLSEHFYCGESPDLVTHVGAIRAQIQAKVATHRFYHQTLPSLADRTIRIAMDEWNYWYGDHVYGELGTRYHLKDALGVAAGLHEFFRNSDIIEMANYAQTVNVIGCIKTTKTAAAFATTGLVLKLYRREFGPNPVAITGDFGPLDVAAAWTANKSALTVGIVNPLNHGYAIPLTVQGAALSGGGKRFVIAGPDPMAYNTPGEKPAVDILESALDETPAALEVPAFGVVLYTLNATPQ